MWWKIFLVSMGMCYSRVPWDFREEFKALNFGNFAVQEYGCGALCCLIRTFDFSTYTAS